MDAIAVDDLLTVLDHAVDSDGLERSLGEAIHRLELALELGGDPRPLQEDAHVLGGEHDPLLEAAQHPGVQLVDPHPRARLAREVANPSEVIDVSVSDHDVPDIVEGDALAETLAHLFEALVEPLDRRVGARAHIHQGEGVAIHDEIDVVHVPGKRLHGHPVHPDAAAARELLDGHRLPRRLGHALTVPRGYRRTPSQRSSSEPSSAFWSVSMKRATAGLSRLPRR